LRSCKPKLAEGVRERFYNPSTTDSYAFQEAYAACLTV